MRAVERKRAMTGEMSLKTLLPERNEKHRPNHHRNRLVMHAGQTEISTRITWMRSGANAALRRAWRTATLISA